MAHFVQLDVAAKEVGKSEVTLRRLIKSGKVGHRKEKTLTGFIYLVDVEQVRAYYEQHQGTPVEVEKLSSEDLEKTTEATLSEEERARRAEAREERTVRLAVTGESGSMAEYWQKRAQAFEERYHRELARHAEAREEMGVWRGKAEQAQEMLSKLLPAVTVREAESKAEVAEQPTPESAAAQSVQKSSKSEKTTSTLMVVLVVVLVSAVAFFGGMAVYLLRVN